MPKHSRDADYASPLPGRHVQGTMTCVLYIAGCGQCVDPTSLRVPSSVSTHEETLKIRVGEDSVVCHDCSLSKRCKLVMTATTATSSSIRRG